jgi:hypothetical protein
VSATADVRRGERRTPIRAPGILSRSPSPSPWRMTSRWPAPLAIRIPEFARALPHLPSSTQATSIGQPTGRACTRARMVSACGLVVDGHQHAQPPYVSSQASVSDSESSGPGCQSRAAGDSLVRGSKMRRVYPAGRYASPSCASTAAVNALTAIAANSAVSSTPHTPMPIERARVNSVPGARSP